MINLTQIEKEDFLRKHLRHRLTLLRTLRKRPSNKHNYQNQGDIYRCVKDCNLIAVRLLMDFLGLKGKYENGNFTLAPITNIQPTDVKIDTFIPELLAPSEVSANDQRILGGVYCRADKELAHITTTFYDEFNNEEILIKAATIVERLIQTHLYNPLGEPFPEIDE